MYKTVNIPKEINTKIKIYKSIYLFDLVIIIIGILVINLLKSVVSSKIDIFYYTTTIGMLFFMLSPSPNKKRKNYEFTIQIIKYLLSEKMFFKNSTIEKSEEIQPKANDLSISFLWRKK